MLDERTKGYIAGIIDGEGSLMVYPFKTKKGYVIYQSRLAVCNTKKELIDYLMKTTGIGRTRVSHTPLRKPFYYWALSSENIRKFLPIIFPYLLLKRKQAELLLEYLSIVKVGYRHPQGEDRRVGIAAEMRRLNTVE